MSYSEAELTRMLKENPDVVIVTDGNYTALEPVTKLPQAKLSEHDMQVKVFEEIGKRIATRPAWANIFAIPNGGHRHVAVAGKLKAEGVRAGVPDIFVAHRRHGYGGMFIELKVGTNKPTATQADWRYRLSEAGYFCNTVWNDPDKVIENIEWYLDSAI